MYVHRMYREFELRDRRTQSGGWLAAGILGKQKQQAKTASSNLQDGSSHPHHSSIITINNNKNNDNIQPNSQS